MVALRGSSQQKFILDYTLKWVRMSTSVDRFLIQTSLDMEKCTESVYVRTCVDGAFTELDSIIFIFPCISDTHAFAIICHYI